MRAPLEATETLMPDQMDMDRIRCLFETCMGLKGNFCVRSICGCLQMQVPIGNGRLRCKMTQGLDWLYMQTFFDFELATSSDVTDTFLFSYSFLFFLQGCRRFKMHTAPN